MSETEKPEKLVYRICGVDFTAEEIRRAKMNFAAARAGIAFSLTLPTRLERAETDRHGRTMRRMAEDLSGEGEEEG